MTLRWRRLFVMVGRKWEEIPNGPFPITQEEFAEMRARYRAEWDAAPRTAGVLGGIRAAPHTTARMVVREVAPHVSEFDAGMIAYAVGFPGAVRVEVDGDVSSGGV